MRKSGVAAKTVAADQAHDSAKARFFYAGVFALKKSETRGTSRTPKKNSSVDSRRR